MAADPRRVKELFVAALDFAEPEARAAFLEQQCAGDTELRQRLDVLLYAHDQPASALDRPMASPEATGAYPASPAEPTEKPGLVLAGRYKLLEAIGEGGMGTVWVAEQTAPVRRKVALKLIKAGMDSRTVLARFEAERQALALMDHPNIAKVLDGGTTESGRPFFVMEYVKGVPFTKYCDDARLSIAERLALFVPVCQAVQHAHQKGIIHRDLKPSNVLVCLYDGVPVPKVIDFGLAKAMHQPLTEHTLHTAHGVMLGTPLYMSPEQAEFNNLDVDTRTDVYALGVILYELLTGTTPLEKQRFQEAAWHEMLRLIKEEEPPRPSARLSGSGSLPSLAAQRQMEPVRLTRLVRGELDWVVMKALEKDRSRRYETASGLARDLERFLRDETVEACPPSPGYRLRKFLRRHKAPVLGAVALVLVLLAGIIGTTSGLVRAESARREALQAQLAEVEQRRLAEANEQRARDAADAEKQAKETAQVRERETRAVLDFLQNQVFAAATPEARVGAAARKQTLPADPGPNVTLRQAIAAAVPVVDRSFRDQPLIEARLRTMLGYSFLYQGEMQTSAEQFRAAHALCAKHRGPEHPDTLSSMNDLATVEYGLGRHAQAFKLWEEALVRCNARLGDGHPEAIRSGMGLATGYAALDRHADAVKLGELTLAYQEAAYGPDHAATLWTRANLALSYAALGRHAEAVTLHERTLAQRRTKLGPDHPDTLRSMGYVALSYEALGRHPEALKLREEAHALRQAKLGADHPDTLVGAMAVARSLAKVGRRAEALTQCRALVARAEKLNRTDVGSLYDVACWRAVTAAILHASDPVAAIAEADRAMAVLRRAVAAGFHNVAHMKKDADLNALRDRADFKELLAGIVAPGKPSR